MSEPRAATTVGRRATPGMLVVCRRGAATIGPSAVAGSDRRGISLRPRDDALATNPTAVLTRCRGSRSAGDTAVRT